MELKLKQELELDGVKHAICGKITPPVPEPHRPVETGKDPEPVFVAWPEGRGHKDFRLSHCKLIRASEAADLVAESDKHKVNDDATK